ncbi:hypothetical protein [Bosea thiooxidans]
MRYTDELDAVIAHAEALRRRIAERVAEEAGSPVSGSPTQAQFAAADAAIEAWFSEGEEEQDLRAFRAIGPLQQLLADYAETVERIEEMRDRRLS